MAVEAPLHARANTAGFEGEEEKAIAEESPEAWPVAVWTPSGTACHGVASDTLHRTNYFPVVYELLHEVEEDEERE